MKCSGRLFQLSFLKLGIGILEQFRCRVPFYTREEAFCKLLSGIDFLINSELKFQLIEGSSKTDISHNTPFSFSDFSMR